jgi:hypothetical protein
MTQDGDLSAGGHTGNSPSLDEETAALLDTASLRHGGMPWGVLFAVVIVLVLGVWGGSLLIDWLRPQIKAVSDSLAL